MANDSGSRTRWIRAVTGTVAIAVLAYLQVLTGFMSIMISLVSPGSKVILQQQDVGLRRDSVIALGAEISEAVKRSLAAESARPVGGDEESYRIRRKHEKGVGKQLIDPSSERMLSTDFPASHENYRVAIGSGEGPPSQPRRTLDEIPSEHD